MDQHIHELCLRFYEACDSAHSLSCAILLRAGEWDQLANRKTDPNVFLTARHYSRSAYANDLVRKLKQLPSQVKLADVALEKWRLAEQQCFRTNRKIWDLLYGSTPYPHSENFFQNVKKTISTILGKAPSEVELRFGPGATFLRRSSNSTIPDKISCEPELTGNAWLFHEDFRQSAWYRSLTGTLFGGEPRGITVPHVEGNRFVTVPKDAKTDRAIAIEPSLNIAIQLGLGSHIRRRLNRIGLLGDSAQEFHRTYAQLGSKDSTLATIDLSSASDTVAYELVRAVMPDDWFQLLDACRSPKTVFPDGSAVLLEKFSSMGNGYTFELETLIFYAILKQCTQDDFLSVFGDDIIVSDRCASVCIELLGFCGFSINTDKTFLQGPFRESCGGDFFEGVPVRGIFLKDLSTWDVPDLFVYHNLFKRVGAHACCEYILSLIPRRYRNLFGPSILGDIILHGVGQPIEKDCILYYRCLRLLPYRYPLNRWDDDTVIASLLYGVSSDGVSPREPSLSFRIGKVARS